MSQKRLSMRKIRELLRLKYELGRSHREIAASLGVANSTVSDYVRRARAAGFSLAVAGGAGRHGAVPAPAAVAGSPAGAGLGPRPPGASATKGRNAVTVVAGDREIHTNGYPIQLVLRALQGVAGTPRRGAAASLPGGREGVRRLRGPEVPGGGPGHRGGARRHGLRRVVGASNHTFVDVTWSRTLPHWTMSHVRMSEFWAGVPELVIPDNEKAGCAKPAATSRI